jgi:hypothetical protein
MALVRDHFSSRQSFAEIEGSHMHGTIVAMTTADRSKSAFMPGPLYLMPETSLTRLLLFLGILTRELRSMCMAKTLRLP